MKFRPKRLMDDDFWLAAKLALAEAESIIDSVIFCRHRESQGRWAAPGTDSMVEYARTLADLALRMQRSRTRRHYGFRV